MKICIIGWYGTETIGDRAILAGVLSVLVKAFGSIEVRLGSLYPFFSERTLNEDYDFFKKTTGATPDIRLFNSKKITELKANIKGSDLVLMGGGPLMDLDELFMVEYAFKYARKMKVATSLMGCGVGPLYRPKYRKAVVRLTEFSDVIICRDEVSKGQLRELLGGNEAVMKKVSSSIDPAAFVMSGQDRVALDQRSGYIAVNFRQFPHQYSRDPQTQKYDERIRGVLQTIAEGAPGKKIILTPMHYFYVGGDDRFFLNRLKDDLGLPDIEVQNEPLSLEATIRHYASAKSCYGMRFHAVVFQTIVNGVNFVVDYTEPKIGKISGFLREIDGSNVYSDRYLSLQEDRPFTCFNNGVPFEFKESVIDAKFDHYVSQMSLLCK